MLLAWRIRSLPPDLQVADNAPATQLFGTERQPMLERFQFEIALSGELTRLVIKKDRRSRYYATSDQIERLPCYAMLIIVVAVGGGIGFSALLAKYCFSRQFDLIAFLADALYEDLLAFLQLVAHVFDPSVCNFGNV